MKLITHNFLACKIKGVKNGYPLKIECEQMEERDADFDPDFLHHIFPRINWPALVEGAKSMGVELPPSTTPKELEDDEELMKTFHRALLKLHLEEGALVCPESGRRFPVTKGIPNMLLHEDEVE